MWLLLVRGLHADYGDSLQWLALPWLHFRVTWSQGAFKVFPFLTHRLGISGAGHRAPRLRASAGGRNYMVKMVQVSLEALILTTETVSFSGEGKEKEKERPLCMRGCRREQN